MAEPIEELFILPPCETQLDIIAIDEHFLLINKPAQLLSVPGRHPQNRDSVISRLLPQYPGASIVHRLDFDTSGIMIIPLNKLALSHISKQFQARSLTKDYIAVVHGIIKSDTGIIDLPIAPDMNNRPKYKICHLRGKTSVTKFQVLERNHTQFTTRVRLQPITGRSHQLRLHLQALGHPILGCQFYGGPVAQDSKRLLLHATQVQFTHPATGAIVVQECPPNF